MNDKFIQAYRLAKAAKALRAVATTVGCTVETLGRYKSNRDAAGHERATKVYSAFISHGFLPSHTELRDVFPRWSAPFNPRSKTKLKPSRTPFKHRNEAVERGSLAELWLSWLVDPENPLTIDTIRVDVMQNCGIARDGPKQLSNKMQHNCDMFMAHAQSTILGVGGVVDEWILESAA